MRFSVMISVALALCGLAGCPLSRSDELSGEPGSGDDDGVGGMGSGAPQSFCMTDNDCELSSSSCCDCPSFATSRGAPTNDACTGIVCPNPPTCPAVRAACNTQKFQCEVACVELACATECPDGYAIDPATGCLSCQCATANMAGSCTLDSDCVQTREDCCGCARGGKDTAVPVGSRAAYDQMLSCPSNPQCPGLDTCDADSVPRCIQGTCLLTDAAYPAAACTGACASGTCVLNRDPDATTHGVGVCVPP